MFVVSAHYDHLGIRDGVIYPGADDNASGVAVLLELAAYCRKNPFRRSIVFAAFDAEEGGLNGARAFVASPPIAKDRIALNVNLDMVSRSDKREIYIAGTFHTPDLKAPLEKVAKTARVKVLFGHDRPGTRQRRLDQPVRSLRLPRGEDSVRLLRRRRPRRLSQADRHRRQDQPRLFRRRRGDRPRRRPAARRGEMRVRLRVQTPIFNIFAKSVSDFAFSIAICSVRPSRSADDDG